uniref:CD3 gamma/delta subunit Ig-like domain-containing protein n=1 Tax=Monopterus albus TaxID=43700 RepID=A0A3Q3KFE1_MONAL
MKCHLVLAECLLLWILTENITVHYHPDGIKLECPVGYDFESGNKSMVLEYKDENSKEYVCSTDTQDVQIFVKFRTCDNCIELDPASIAGIVIGEVVATVMVGVAVYLIASQAQVRPVTSYKKSSDRQHLVPNEMNSRAPNDHYERLKPTHKDMYDVIHNRK